MFCLIPSVANKFIERLRSGEINPDALNAMTSVERHKYFSEFMGEENAGRTNALFESKLLLQNQKQGMINWARSVAGIKPEVRKDIIARINRMEKVLNPEEQGAFLKDLASQRLGTSVTVEEAAKISDLAKKVEETRQAVSKGGDRFEHGRALVEFNKYFNSLKDDATKIRLIDFKKNPGDTTLKAASKTAGLAKSLKATLDLSAIFRQGFRPMLTDSKIWLSNSLKSFSDAVRTFGGKEVMDEVHADILSRPNALNGLYKKEKLAIGTGEEAYPTSLPEKIPGLGRLFKSSEVAYKAFLERTRADVFDKLVEIAQKSGGDVEGIGKLVNSLTGRGNLGKLERSADTINNVFFSPRNLKAHIDFLTAHRFDKDVGSFAKKRAAINLVKVISGTASILAIADALAPGSVEKDPRSSDFGKIRIKDTRFDVSGGMSSLLVLASRLASMSSKSSTSGKVYKLNTGGFGSQDGTDMIYNFMENKLSPAASVVKDILKGQDFDGNKPTVLGEAKNLFMPLPIENYLEVKDKPNAAPMILTLIADALGVGTNTYSKRKLRR